MTNSDYRRMYEAFEYAEKPQAPYPTRETIQRRWMRGAYRREFLANWLSSRQMRLLSVAFCRWSLPAVSPGAAFASDAILKQLDGSDRPRANAYVKSGRLLQLFDQGSPTLYLAMAIEKLERAVNLEVEPDLLGWATRVDELQYRLAAVKYFPGVPPPRLAVEQRSRASFARIVASFVRSPDWTLKPAWKTSTVVGLAQDMFASRKFDAMPMLADALQDADCDCASLLAWCRTVDVNEVFRGNWLIDALSVGA